MNRSALRPLAGLAVLACLAATAACGSEGDKEAKPDSDSSASPSASAGCEVAAGSTSDAVKVTGAFGKEQKATFDTPLKATGLQRTLVDEGDGESTEDIAEVDTVVTVYLGSGKSLGTQPLSFRVGDKTLPQVFTGGAGCLPLGSRTVATAPAKEVYGEQGNPQAGIAADETLVVVSDLVSEKEQLVPEKWSKDVPKVSMGGKQPKVTMPDTKPPAKLQLKVLKEGDGAEIKSGDTVTLDYQGTSWNTGKVFDQSYGKQPASFATDQVVPGFGAALVGQKVGSRVIVTIPPKYAYGKKGSGSELSGQTLVFLIDIKDATAS